MSPNGPSDFHSPVLVRKIRKVRVLKKMIPCFKVSKLTPKTNSRFILPTLKNFKRWYENCSEIRSPSFWFVSISETKCVGDNLEMLLTILTVIVTNILYLSIFASDTDIQKMSSAFTCHQHLCSFKNVFYSLDHFK